MKKYLNVLLKIYLTAILMISFSCTDNGTSNDNTIIEWNKKIAKIAVHNQAVVISELIKPLSNPNDIINLIRLSVDSVRFYDDNSGYFYVYDNNCICIAHATQHEKQGENLYDYKDVKGKFVI